MVLSVPTGLLQFHGFLANAAVYWSCFQVRMHCCKTKAPSTFSNENGAVLFRFQKKLRPHLSFSPVHTTTPYPFENANSTHAHFNISAWEIGAILDSLLLIVAVVKSVKRLEIIPIKREATWNRLSAILDTHGRVGWRPVVSI